MVQFCHLDPLVSGEARVWWILCHYPRNIDICNGKHKKKVCVCVLSQCLQSLQVHAPRPPHFGYNICWANKSQQFSFHTRFMLTIHTTVLTCSFSCCLWQAKLACIGVFELAMLWNLSCVPSHIKKWYWLYFFGEQLPQKMAQPLYMADFSSSMLAMLGRFQSRLSSFLNQAHGSSAWDIFCRG